MVVSIEKCIFAARNHIEKCKIVMLLMPSLILISNEREVYQNGKVTYMPIYFVMFMEADKSQIDEEEYIF